MSISSSPTASGQVWTWTKNNNDLNDNTFDEILSIYLLTHVVNKWWVGIILYSSYLTKHGTLVEIDTVKLLVERETHDYTDLYRWKRLA